MEEENKGALRKFSLCHVSPRLLGFAATAAAALITAFNSETTTFGTVQMRADYKTISISKFLISANAVVGAYCMASMFMCFVGIHRPKLVAIMHALDLLMMGLVAAAAGAGSVVAHVGKSGEPSAGWMPVCSYFPKFCDRAGFALVLSFLGFACCFCSCLMHTVHRGRSSGGNGGSIS